MHMNVKKHVLKRKIYESRAFQEHMRRYFIIITVKTMKVKEFNVNVNRFMKDREKCSSSLFACICVARFVESVLKMVYC